MILSKKEFDVLTNISCLQAMPTQRQLSKMLNISLGSINTAIKSIHSKGYIDDSGKLTSLGQDALESYRVKRAVFIAAGFGSRLVPVTLKTPKPLVKVNGKRIIDTLIDALVEASITDIYIVRGYLAEQFDQLLEKYPFIKFLENPYYNESNNISSALIAKELLSNSYVCEADLLVQNPSIIKKYQYSSNILGIKKDVSSDWCFTVKSGVIVKYKIGGKNCYQEVGITYLSDEDGKKLSKHLPEAFDMPGGKELFWEQTLYKVFKSDYKIMIRECEDLDVLEIDTFNELKNIDKSYGGEEV